MLAAGLAWLALLCQSSPAAAGSSGMGLLMAGPSCPDAEVSSKLERGLRRRSQACLPHVKVAAALARVRAERALAQGRDLFTRTNFDACIALLSITEQELGRNLADPDETLLRRAHSLLAEINLWLGICQWAAGDPQTAAGSFVRAAQLPANPSPDPKLLPPELTEAHRAALSAPRQDVRCELLPPLRPEHLLVDGRVPDFDGEHFRVAAGTHYVTLQASCRPGDPACRAVLQHLGGHGRSLRLEASPLRCRVQVPSRLAASRITCASASEVGEPSFIAALTRESQSLGTLAISQTGRRLMLQLHRQGSAGFARQIVTELESHEAPAQLVERSIGLLLGLEPVSPPRRPEAWYQRWWVWALVGAAVVATTTTAVAITRAQPQREYVFRFEP